MWVVVYLAASGEALSCWKMKGAFSSPKHFPMDGRRFSSNIVQYLAAFIVPSTTANLPTPAAVMHPHTITDGPFMNTG